MRRFGTFLFGFLLGGAAVYFSLHYHYVRSDEGWHMVPKLQSTLSQTYVDIRNFGYEEWNQHRSLAIALVYSQKGHLVQGIATDSLQNTVRELLGQ